jgi:hypothetical protein
MVLEGPARWPNSLAGRPGLKSVRPMASWTRVYMRRGRPKVVEKGGGSHSTRPAGRPLVSYCLGQVDGAPLRPYKYRPLVEIRTHTPLLGNSTCKALSLSVVARCSLMEEWRGSEGRRASHPIGSPPRSSSAEALSKSFKVQ